MSLHPMSIAGLAIGPLLLAAAGCDGADSPPNGTPAPLDPPGLEARSPRTVRVFWEQTVWDSAPGLVVQRQAEGGEPVMLEPVAGAEEILDIGLEPDGSHEYRLCPGPDAPDGDCSAWVAASTPASELGLSVDVTVPYQGDEGADDLTMISVIDFVDPASYGAIVVVDRAGRIVWEHFDPSPGFINDVSLLDDGSLLFNEFLELRQMDLYRRPVRLLGHEEQFQPYEPDEFEPVTVTTQQYYHHDVDPFGDDAFLSLTYLIRYDEIRQDDVLGDGVVVLDKETGEERWFIDLFDYYDTHVDYCPVCIETDFFGMAKNWSHGNALWFDEQQSHIYINLRNLDRILVVEYPSGDVVREIGDGGQTFAHAHDPEILPDGSILLFDNGLHRPGGEMYSRAVQFREGPSGLEEIWEYREDPDFFNPAMGEADRLANGDTLVADSAGGRLIEVQPDGTKVWEIEVRPLGFPLYRTQRISAATFRGHCGLQ